MGPHFHYRRPLTAACDLCAAQVWFSVGSAGFSAGAATYLSLAMHPTTGAPYVAYRDGNHSNKATVMTFAAGA